jgi:hypothetical protein
VQLLLGSCDCETGNSKFGFICSNSDDSIFGNECLLSMGDGSSGLWNSGIGEESLRLNSLGLPSKTTDNFDFASEKRCLTCRSACVSSIL